MEAEAGLSFPMPHAGREDWLAFEHMGSLLPHQPDVKAFLTSVPALNVCRRWERAWWPREPSRVETFHAKLKAWRQAVGFVNPPWPCAAGATNVLRWQPPPSYSPFMTISHVAFIRRHPVCLAILALLALALPVLAAEKPNILFIITDDIGYGDLSCYGATKVQTPTLDRLASQGCRFTDAHSTASTCTPTRYALLTGQYAWRHFPGSRILPGDAPLGIPTNTVTLPRLLQRAGYFTGIVGKWHLGLGDLPKTDYNLPLNPGPLEVGFDSAFIIPATGDRVPCVFVENHRVVGLDPADPITLDYSVKRGEPKSFVRGIPRIGGMTGGQAALWKDAEIADTLAQRAIQFLEQHRAEPFFLYFATHGIHVPRVPHPRFKGTSQSGVRGDQIHELDDTVRQVLAALDRLNLTDRTLVIFTSDNGGVLDTNGPDSVNSGDPETANGHLANGPLRGTKGTVLEGGHRVPFLARWPGRIKPGATNDALFGLVDMAATFAALTGVPLPPEAAPDSFNALPALLNQPGAQPVRDHLVLHNGGTNGPFGLRAGQWKLIAPAGGLRPANQRNTNAPAGQLYNLAVDLGETNNLAATQPDKRREMQALLAKVRRENRSRP